MATTKRTLPLAALQQLLAYLFDERPHDLATPVEYWLTSSKSFASFAQTYQQKIRKKVRTAQDAEEIHNLYCELRTAYLLLQERKFAVEYEPYTKQFGRSPDFGVTYRTNTPFHVEVTRLRASSLVEQLAGQATDGDQDSEDTAAIIRRYEGRRLADTVCGKLGQLLSNTPNILWVWVQSPVMLELEVDHLLLGMKRRAEQRDMEMLARYGFRNPADFIHHYQRLSVMLIQNSYAQAGASPLAWHNKDARYPLPAKVRTTLHSLITADRSPHFAPGRQEDAR